jgi:copper chaperone
MPASSSSAILPPSIFGHVTGEVPMSAADERAYTVQGMTCSHCTAAVAEEVGAVPGVTGVEVDLASGRLVVRGEGFGDDAVAAAVEEAGYAVTP